jgi:Zn-dependent protease
MINISEIILFLSVLLVSVSLHEMMHAYVAYRLGDDLAHSRGRISLNPLVHIDPVLTIALPAVLLLLGQPPILAAKPVPINTSRIDGDEYGLALVGVSGPLTNLALAFLGGFLFGLLEPTGILFEVLKLFVQINVGLFVFNMLPLPPLDGSRLLYAVAPEGLRNVMRQIEGFGIFGLILILWFILPIISPVLSTVNDYILNLVV